MSFSKVFQNLSEISFSKVFQKGRKYTREGRIKDKTITATPQPSLFAEYWKTLFWEI